jgi:hypothetical protein
VADTPAKSQRDRFIETARALGADEDEAAFKAKLAVIARQKPKVVEELNVTTKSNLPKRPLK